MKVYKYRIALDNARVGIQVPLGAKAIGATEQDGTPYIYYAFDEAYEFTTEMREVIALYTGLTISGSLSSAKHIGTVQSEHKHLSAGNEYISYVVWHVFEF